MIDRLELIEATLDSLTEGVALLGDDSQVVVWNRAAEAITGHCGADLFEHPVPVALKPLLEWCAPLKDLDQSSSHRTGQGFLVHIRHKLGHEVSTIARVHVLQDVMGGRLGAAVLFHPAERLDALPHGETGENDGIETSQADLKDRLESLHEDYTHGGPSFGVLWITVDQAHELRKTHGVGACDTMLGKVERALIQGLRPAEHLGRWGQDEFLVISHERTPAMLGTHAQVLAGLARTADFRWWGDRVSLTVSIGAAQTEPTGTLVNLLERAKAAMFSSFHAGGNRITSAPEGQSCLPS
jgi:diguanylate cyclase (GGDEF)-like protein